MNDAPVFQVSEFVEALNHHLALLGEVTIEGEITRIDIKNNNLIFLTIKDTSSSLDVFTMMHIVRNIRQFEPGMMVHVSGTAGLYKGSGKFRVFATAIIPHGEGALQLAFEKLKMALEAEGLFDPTHKRLLPTWPKSIGLITAKDSSAYYDQIKIISARMGGLALKLLPVTVQGRGAIPTIINAFAYINNHVKDFDVVILARGGGSLEDLAAFNSEEVARAVFASKVPTISAVGHEDDWSLTDYVADVRASTPSNAAEIVVKNRLEVLQEISSNYRSLTTHLTQKIAEASTHIQNAHHLIRHHLQTMTATVNQTMHKIPAIAVTIKTLVETQRKELDQRLPALSLRLHSLVTFKQQDLIHLERLLSSLDYRNVLKRGYSLTYREDGTIIKSRTQTKRGEMIKTQFATNSITSIVT